VSTAADSEPGECGVRGETLQEKLGKAQEKLDPCTLCPRRCEARRLEGETGTCGAGRELAVSSAGPHFGEEDVLVGSGGSGTIFLAGCNLLCLFCQNFGISHLLEGHPATVEEVKEAMLSLQALGCHNINFVTPTHVTPQLMEAVLLAREEGLEVPIVYNCGGYESKETLELLDGFVEIYMPDLKFMDARIAGELADAPDYPEKAKEAIREMHRQVGDLDCDARGRARRGLLVRHLVLPGGLAGTREAMRFLAEEISKDTYVNIMDQYRPCYKADRYAPVNRGITRSEFSDARTAARDAGLYRGI